MSAAAGVRTLSVLRKFKPFGLTVETIDGNPERSDLHEKYAYFLFSPEITRDRNNASEYEAASASCDSSDHEIFIRGNQIIWSAGSRVHRRYTASSPIVMACWCRMETLPEPTLCVLQVETLTMYRPSGEVVRLPLTHSISSIWSLPFGLLLQRASDGLCPFTASNPSLCTSDLSRINREHGAIPQYDYSSHCSAGCSVESELSITASHFILKHPLQEPQVIIVEERGKPSIMNDLDEKIIWTGETIPLVASYNKGKMQHCIWRIDRVVYNSETKAACLRDHAHSPDDLSKQFCFHKIWQGKKSPAQASKVFSATDGDGMPIICFLLQEQKCLFSVRLQTGERFTDIFYDVKPEMSWSVPAIAAAPVVVTRPRVKVSLLQFSDVLVINKEKDILLYSGRQCFCKYTWPINIQLGVNLGHPTCLGQATIGVELKVTGLADAVDGRVNLILENGQMFRCNLQTRPSSSLVNDCITALAEGLHPTFYSQFVVMLWGDGDPTSLAKADIHINSEWESFTNVIMAMCKRLGFNSSANSDTTQSSWEFLIQSQYHLKYSSRHFFSGFSIGSIHELKDFKSTITCNLAEQSRETSFCVQFLTEALDALHAVYENYKLDNLRKGDINLLVSLLLGVATSLGESNYVDHYIRDFPVLLLESRIFQPASIPRMPPCLFRWLQACLRNGSNFANCDDLPPLLRRDGSLVVDFSRKIVSFYSLLMGSERVGRKLSSGVYCNLAEGSAYNNEQVVVLAMVAETFGLQQMDQLPAGISLPLRHALDKCRESPPDDWPAAAYMLVGREDLALISLGSFIKCRKRELTSENNLVAFSSPYLLNVRSVTIPSSSLDKIGVNSNKMDDVDTIDGSVPDGMEHVFSSSTQMRFGHDLRLHEVRRLLCSARPVPLQSSASSNSSEQDMQQAHLWQLAHRTTALPLGRGAFTLATTCTFMTEALVVPKLVLAGHLPSQHNATVNLDPTMRNLAEHRSWPEFHNGVAAGLRLAPVQGKISRTWIVYNKPEEPNATHAGILLALGLRGHLRVLIMTDVYQYLSQQHDITTVGILLGVAASFRGTMDPAISKMLYVHVPSRHPASFPELELPTVVQSAALLAIGLLYEGSAHPLAMDILLGEIGRRSSGDSVLEREGYAVAAGFALGLVCLGRGLDASGHMGSCVEQLFRYIYGSRKPYRMMDDTLVNVDVTSPGATVALALMFLKTESEVVASRLLIPQTCFDLQYVRPDFLMLRVIARNLIMWKNICPSQAWINSQIPEIVKNSPVYLNVEFMDNDDADIGALAQAFVNILTAACVLLGLKYAGSRNAEAQELLYDHAIYLLYEIKPLSGSNKNIYPTGLVQHVDRGTLETCLHIIVLSLSVVMAGSGHLQTFRLLKFLRGRTVDGQMNYGFQMAVSLAIGFLFLGGGMHTFSTGNTSIAALLIALYPRLPVGPHDNRCHLQAFRHLYVLATEARCVQTIDVDTGLSVYTPLEVTIREAEYHTETTFCEVTPCILPEHSLLKSVHVCGPRYWPQEINLLPDDKQWLDAGGRINPFSGQTIYVKRKVGACSYVDDPIGCQSLLSRVMYKVFDIHSINAPRSKGDNGQPGVFKVDQLVSTFSANPSLIAFSRFCCDNLWTSSSDADFRDFCAQMLFDCMSKDRPGLLQVYLSLYTIILSMCEQATSNNILFSDTLFLSSLKVALAYNEALVNGLLNHSTGVIQSTFLASLGRRIEDILVSWSGASGHLLKYLADGKCPFEDMAKDLRSTLLLSCYLQWFEIPSSSIVQSAVSKIKVKAVIPSVPFLHMLLPATHINALSLIYKLLVPNTVK
ncbi:anaphase-promoting complex subunit 1 isoform X2 [Nymphaea colorata]|uniref:anaphase-promoting complex subunit 1 isoform X2 n=1 Tax=Nymphaea colorata TaxID=210225 RepID=UPI00129D5B17|nr:anaphase-promoting complex subunit 1 isoform X2 [Nymphaea colorata]